MSYRFNEDQRRIRELIRRIAAERVAPRAMKIDARAEYPQDMLNLLRKLGLFTLPFPHEYGGSGSLVSACLAIEEFGRVCYNTAYLLLLQWVPFGAILAGGDEPVPVRATCSSQGQAPDPRFRAGDDNATQVVGGQDGDGRARFLL
jgi:alkylation response protein AidB-like acyl-CoA dehydrogenase